MSMHLGDVPAGTVLYIPFATYDAFGASLTMSGLAVTDIEIYKNGSVTQRASDAGYTLLDTDGIDFDALTGIHGFSIDLGDNTTAGFFAVGSQYWVVVSSITVNGQTVNFIAATFRIVAAETAAGTSDVNVTAIAANAITAASMAADVTTELQTGLATAAALSTIDDFLDTEIAAIVTATGAAAIRAALGLASANLDTQLSDIPTNAELATSQGTADDATLAAIATLQTTADDIPTNAELATALGTSDDATLTAIAGLDTKIDTIDNLLDTEIGALTTAVADIPTNAELATALGTADDATLAAIAALNNLSAAQVNTEVDTALTDYDGPTNAELTTALGLVDDDILAALIELDGIIAEIPTNAELTTALGTADNAILAILGTPAGASLAEDIAAGGGGGGLDAAGVRAAVGLATANLDTQLGAPLAVNITKVKGQSLAGVGTRLDPWRPV